MTKGKRALITGILGQDGMFLSKMLCDKGYEVYGLIRGQNNPKVPGFEAWEPRTRLIYGDLTDISSLINAVEISQPDEVYNLGALSFVGASWKQPELTSNVTGLGALRLLEAIRIVKPDARFYQASSSEMFGQVREVPQTEMTPFHPRSPYGVAKAYAHYMTVNYRESYNLFACSGILFNHESEFRGHEFVTRKISDAVARIYHGLSDHVMLGNLDAQRDWGYAKEYVEAMWLMLQQDEPDDYVIATNELHSVRDFLAVAFAAIGLPAYSKYVRQDERFMRPAEVNMLIGDYSKAKEKLGWQPRTSFYDLVNIMVKNDIELLAK